MIRVICLDISGADPLLLETLYRKLEPDCCVTLFSRERECSWEWLTGEQLR